MQYHGKLHILSNDHCFAMIFSTVGDLRLSAPNGRSSLECFRGGIVTHDADDPDSLVTRFRSARASLRLWASLLH